MAGACANVASAEGALDKPAAESFSRLADIYAPMAGLFKNAANDETNQFEEQLKDYVRYMGAVKVRTGLCLGCNRFFAGGSQKSLRLAGTVPEFGPLCARKAREGQSCAARRTPEATEGDLRGTNILIVHQGADAISKGGKSGGAEEGCVRRSQPRCAPGD